MGSPLVPVRETQNPRIEEERRGILGIPQSRLILRIPPQRLTFSSHNRTTSVTKLTSSRDHLFYFQTPKILKHSA